MLLTAHSESNRLVYTIDKEVGTESKGSVFLTGYTCVCCSLAIHLYSTTESAAFIRNALEATILAHLMPRTQIDIVIQVLQADGGQQGAALNAAMVALIDAGNCNLALYSTSAVSLVIVKAVTK